MVQRNVLLIDSGHQAFDALGTTDIPDLSGTYDSAAARDSAIAAAIAALISSAPGALDTLDEIAAALGDDANFAATIATSLAGKQPLDSDLTALAALTTTAYGRALLELADAAAARTALVLGTAATHATGDFDAAGTAAAAQAASQPLDSDLTAIAALSTTSYGRAFLALADAAAARTALALGTAATAASGDFDAAGAAAAAQAASQPLDSDLTAFAGLAIAADKLPYGTGSHTFGLADFSAAGRALVDDADAAAQRTTLGLGTAATQASGAFDAAGAAAAAQGASQPLDSDLTAIAALTTTAYGRAFLALADAAAARTALALGTAATSASGDFQPIDADLTSIAAISTTAFGRALLALADPADATKFLNGAGAFSVPSGGSGLTHPQVMARGLGA